MIAFVLLWRQRTTEIFDLFVVPCLEIEMLRLDDGYRQRRQRVRKLSR
jgi:hypothetical protein